MPSRAAASQSRGGLRNHERHCALRGERPGVVVIVQGPGPLLRVRGGHLQTPSSLLGLPRSSPGLLARSLWQGDPGARRGRPTSALARAPRSGLGSETQRVSPGRSSSEQAF